MQQRWIFGAETPVGSKWKSFCFPFADPRHPDRENQERAPRASHVTERDWVRLVPVGGLEAALVERSGVEFDELKRPHVRHCDIDRKLVEEGDLFGEEMGVGTFASERFARALVEVGATGVRLEIIPHITPNRVAGRRLFRVLVTGETGPFCDTKFRLGRNDLETFDPAFPKAQPILPVYFDASKASGDTVMLSPWVGVGDAEWQGLIVSGDIYLKLVAKLGPLLCGSERVAYRGEWKRTDRPRAVLVDDESPEPYVPPPVEETLAAIVAGVERYKHVLGDPPSDAALDTMTKIAGFELDKDYVRVIRALGGACLFGGALYLLSPDPEVGQWVALGNDELLQMPFEGEWVPIGHMRNKGYWWVIGRNGHVCAWGENGTINGPDVDFASWLDGQVKDVGYALDHENELEWASVVLDR